MGFLNKIFGNKKTNNEPLKNNGFIPSKELMDENKFWEIISTSKEKSSNDFELQQNELKNELKKLNPNEIILFGNSFRHYRGKANTWELWGAIYIINGGCGDDMFNDFREWVIGQGKYFYYKTIQNPETLVELDSELIEDTELEGLGYVPSDVFETITGEEMPYLYQEKLETTGHEWDEDNGELKSIFPNLYAKYPDNV